MFTLHRRLESFPTNPFDVSSIHGTRIVASRAIIYICCICYRIMTLYSRFHGQDATNKIYLKLTTQWDLFAFFARCLLVAERMNEVAGESPPDLFPHMPGVFRYGNLIAVEKSMDETVKAFNCDSTTFNEVVTPLWFNVFQRFSERELLRPSLHDLTSEELKMEARMNTQYCYNCPPDCPHERGFTTPSEVTRTALDAWRTFGHKIGLDEDRLLGRATSQTGFSDANNRSDEQPKFSGCSWVRCALHGDYSPHKMFRCVKCSKVCWAAYLES